MCFGKSDSPPPAPVPPTPGVVDTAKVVADPAGASAYRGRIPDANTTGRYGGGLLLDAAARQEAKTSLGA